MRAFRIGARATLWLSVVMVLGVLDQPAALAQNQGAQAQPEEIVVTGSRIVRRDFTSQSPIVTIDQSSFSERTNVGMEATLNQFPQFTAAGTHCIPTLLGCFNPSHA